MNAIDRIDGGIITCNQILESLEEFRSSVTYSSTAFTINVCMDIVEKNKSSLKNLKIEELEKLKED